jgi:hypothetical protein
VNDGDSQVTPSLSSSGRQWPPDLDVPKEDPL